MNAPLARRVDRFGPSPTLAASAAARKLREAGREIIDWTAGEPDFDTPEPVRAAARAAMDGGQTRYTAVGGTPELIAAVADKLRRDNGLDYEPAQILVSVGVKHALYNCFQALIEPGAEVVIPAPYWASYPDMVRLAGGAPVFLPADAARHFRPAPEQLAAALTERTRLLILNSPSNPCGTMLRRGDLEDYAEVLRAHPQVRVVSDDIYELIRYDGRGFVNLAQAAPDLRGRVLVFNGVSKAYAMTGWRIGYVAGPAEVVRAMRDIQSQSTSSPCSIAQAAAAAALAGDAAPVAAMVAAFQERRDYLVAALDALPGMSCQLPDGAFYCLPDVRGMMARAGCEDDVAFASLLLEELQLATVPGLPFGAPGHVRVSFATDLQTLRRGVEKLQERFA